MLMGFSSVSMGQVKSLDVAPLHYFAGSETDNDWHSYFTVANTGTDARVLVWVAASSMQEKLSQLPEVAVLEDPQLTIERLVCTDPSNVLTCQNVDESYGNDDWQTGATDVPPETGRLSETEVTEVLPKFFSQPLSDTDSALLLDLPAGLYRAHVTSADGTSSGLAELNFYEFSSDAIFDPAIVGAQVSGLVLPNGDLAYGALAFVSAEPEGWLYDFSMSTRIPDSDELASLGLPSQLSQLETSRTFFVTENEDAITHFSVAHTGANVRLLAWAAGPSLSQALDNVAVISDPVISLYSCSDDGGSCDTLVASNDDFGDAPTNVENADNRVVSDASAVGVALSSVLKSGLQETESALLLSLPVGDYALKVENAADPFASGLSYVGLVAITTSAAVDPSTGAIRLDGLDIGLDLPLEVELLPTAGVADYSEYLLTIAEFLDAIEYEEPEIPTIPEVTDPNALNVDELDVSTWANCYAIDDLRQGPLYIPGVENLIAVNDAVTNCVGRLKIIESQRDFELAACLDNPFKRPKACRFTGSFEGDEVYAIRLRLGDLTGQPGITLSVDNLLSLSDHFLTVSAISDVPGKFDVDPACRSGKGEFADAITFTMDEALAKYAFCVLPDPNKVYYLNVRNIDYLSGDLGLITRASSCGATTLQGDYIRRCDSRIQVTALDEVFAFDRVSIPQDTFTVSEGQPVHIPVVLGGGLDGDAKVKFEVVGIVGADDSDYVVLNPTIEEAGEQINGLSWGYGDDSNRTKYISILTHADGVSESLETFIVRITPVGVYLDDGLETFGFQMSSGEYFVQVSILANDT
jgi:hypothetical protein